MAYSFEARNAKLDDIIKRSKTRDELIVGLRDFIEEEKGILERDVDNPRKRSYALDRAQDKLEKMLGMVSQGKSAMPLPPPIPFWTSNAQSNRLQTLLDPYFPIDVTM